MHDLAIIIPCWNESQRIEKTVERLHAFLRERRDMNAIVVLVDDGSTDATRTTLNRIAATSTDVPMRVVGHEKNLGKGAAIASGVRSVDATTYGFLDADGSFAVDDIPRMLDALRNVDLAVGERVRGFSRLRAVPSRILRWITRRIVGIEAPDPQCGFKFFRRSVVDAIISTTRHTRYSFDAELLLLAERARMRVASIPLSFTEQPGSHVRMRDGIRYLLDCLALTDREPVTTWRFPLVLFVLASAVAWSIFGWTLTRGYFFSDDFTWLWHGARVGESLSTLFTARMSTFWSPVMNVLSAIFVRTAFLSAPTAFALGITIHIVASVVTGLLLFRLTESRIAAIVGVLIAAAAGGAYEPLVWVGATMHSIATAAIVAAVFFFDRLLIRGRAGDGIATLVAFLLALGTKEIAIVTPVLFFLLLLLRRKQLRWTTATTLTAIGMIVPTILYTLAQIQWQRASIWVTSGTWEPHMDALHRLPLILLDIVVPIGTVINDHTATALFVVGCLFTVGIALAYARRLPVVLFGLTWAIVATLPTIFFRTATWWEPLASRYTYLPRIGIIIVIASIVAHTVIHNTAKRVVRAIVPLLLLVSIAHVVVMMQTINREYTFVYATGRALVAVASDLTREQPQRIVVRYERPFTENIAHMVGAFYLIAHIPEKNIFFLKKNERVDVRAGDVIIGWDDPARRYTLEHVTQ